MKYLKVKKISELKKLKDLAEKENIEVEETTIFEDVLIESIESEMKKNKHEYKDKSIHFEKLLLK